MLKKVINHIYIYICISRISLHLESLCGIPVIQTLWPMMVTLGDIYPGGTIFYITTCLCNINFGARVVRFLKTVLVAILV